MYNSGDYFGLLSALSGFLILGFVIAYLILLSCVYAYANRLGREGGIWVFFSLLFFPILGAFALWLKGETDEHRKERLVQERKWIMSIGNDKESIIADEDFIESSEKNSSKVSSERKENQNTGLITLIFVIAFLAFMVLIGILS